MDPCTGTGTVTVEYYDESPEFTDSEASECPSVQEEPSPSSSSSTSTQSIRHHVSCKTYDFKHMGSDTDYCEQEPGGSISKLKIFSDAAKDTMKEHYIITQQEQLNSLLHPKASFPRCPRGNVPEPYGRRKHPGPFLTCSFSHSHECGDEFAKIPISTKPAPEFDTFTRPQHLKEKKVKFFKQCKNCETIAFTHHRNPARHYEDYLNNVTYKQHNDHSKVWQQHVVDFMFMLGEDANSFSEDTGILEQCENYKPSESIAKTQRYSRSLQKRIPTVVTRKRTAIARPLRRPLPKVNVSVSVDNDINSTRGKPSVPEQRNGVAGLSEANPTKFSNDADDHSCRLAEPTAKNASSRRMPTGMQVQSDQRSHTSDISIDGPKTNEMHQKLKASVTRLINSRQASSNISKRFVKKPEPPKEVKYIQRGKPNISAKFLQARSKGKVLHSAPHSSDPLYLSKRSRGKSSLTNSTTRNGRYKHAKNSRVVGKDHRQRKPNSLKDDSSDDGSYAQYRDQNGEFDVEKYRQSILKMLSKNLGKGNETPEKKKKTKRSAQSSKPNLVTLPKVKNAYRNVKPRITSNFTQRKKRKVRKSTTDNRELYYQIPSDISLNSKYWNEDSLDSKDSYFSIPSVHDL